MINKFKIDQDKSDTVSEQLQQLVRLIQFQEPPAVIATEIARLRQTLADASEIVTINATVETKG